MLKSVFTTMAILAATSAFAAKPAPTLTYSCTNCVTGTGYTADNYTYSGTTDTTFTLKAMNSKNPVSLTFNATSYNFKLAFSPVTPTHISGCGAWGGYDTAIPVVNPSASCTMDATSAGDVTINIQPMRPH